jgi:hypothetical protein
VVAQCVYMGPWGWVLATQTQRRRRRNDNRTFKTIQNVLNARLSYNHHDHNLSMASNGSIRQMQFRKGNFHLFLEIRGDS